jgi:hypothetical protein
MNDIIRCNRLIAEFMGGEIQPNGTCKNYKKMNIPDWAFRDFDFDSLRISGFMYYTSWDWLMPVVEKIEGLGRFAFAIDSRPYPNINTCVLIHNATQHGITNLVIPVVERESKIEAVYLAVIEFIEWYNLNPTAPN